MLLMGLRHVLDYYLFRVFESEKSSVGLAMSSDSCDVVLSIQVVISIVFSCYLQNR